MYSPSDFFIIVPELTVGSVTSTPFGKFINKLSLNIVLTALFVADGFVNTTLYVNVSDFCANPSFFIDSSSNVLIGFKFGFVGVTVHVPAFTHGSLLSVGTAGVLPSDVTAFTTLLPNALYSAASDVTCNLYVIVVNVPFATLSSV